MHGSQEVNILVIIVQQAKSANKKTAAAEK